MAFTKKSKAAVKALVSCHETGRPVANYSAIVVLQDDAGITYGAHQATHKSGSLYKIVKMYCDMSESPLSKKLDPYVSGFRNPALRHRYSTDRVLKQILVEAGKEPAMRFAQDRIFSVHYLEPAIQAIQGSGWVHPLSLAVVYDSMIQGGWTKVRDRVIAADEKTWIKHYVATRRKWLSSSPRKVVRNSVYRMTTFEKLIESNNWNLDTPFIVHGVRVTEEHLAVWLASDNPHQASTVRGDLERITVEAPEPDFFISNTEGVAEAGGSWDDEIESSDIQESTTCTDLESSSKGQDIVPVETAIMGGRPQDAPIIVEKTEQTPTQGWRTWPTTIGATLGSLGISTGGIVTAFTGVELTPLMQQFVGWVIILGLLTAAFYGLFYLVQRMIIRNKEAQRAHEINLKELELRSMPDRYNVKLDRRGDVSNLTASGLPLNDKREN